MMIYLIEDEKNLRDLLETYLKEAGYQVQSFSTGTEAMQSIQDRIDLWILDIMLPGRDGFELIKEIKHHHPNMPVIFMSARNTELDRVLGLELGSEDYLPKPFLPRELVIRVNRILNRHKLTINHVAPYTLNRQQRQVLENNKNCDLTPKEYDMVAYFFEHPNQALSREMILDAVWGENYFGSVRVIDDTLRRLRKKMPQLQLEVVYGYGYILKVVDHEK
jgi:two-component system response regulator CssR